MKRIVIVWPGFTGYMDACWRELAKKHQVKIYIEPSWFEQDFDGSELAGLDWRRVERREGDAHFSETIEDIRQFRPDAVLLCGWSTPLSQSVAAADVSGVKILAFDMPWEWSFRKIAARWVLIPKLRNFKAAFVPGTRALRYANWLGFVGRVATGSNPSGWERFCDIRPSDSGFLFVGRLSPEKRLDLLVAAYGKYRRQVSNPWRLDIVGGGNGDRPQVDGVTYFGFTRPNEIGGLLAGHAALVLPSRQETWGICAMEAMSAGLMTIVSDACGLTADVEPTVKFRSGDVDGLCQAMVKVHQMSKDDCEKAGEKGRRQAERYSAFHWVERLEGLIEKTEILRNKEI